MDFKNNNSIAESFSDIIRLAEDYIKLGPIFRPLEIYKDDLATLPHVGLLKNRPISILTYIF